MGSSTLTINSNIASLNAQRRLSQNTGRLQDAYSRLSSGMRINRASDDAAGLAVASNLKNDSRVYGQAVRNVNDAISLHNIAEGAMTELSNVVTRIAELAEQSANGVLAYSQRRSLDAEAQALRKEYNRIVDTVEFNGLKLIDGSLSNLGIQTGYDALMLSVDLNTSDVNDGTFKAPNGYGPGATFFSGNYFGSPQFSDVNGDGKVDMVMHDHLASHVMLGNGDGTFKAAKSFSTAPGGDGSRDYELYDVNGDGAVDVVTGVHTAVTASVLINNGDGTFKARVSYAMSTGANLTIGDVTGDGVVDIINVASTGGFAVLTGNSDGTFRAPTVVVSGDGVQGLSHQLIDVNYDGKLDLVRVNGAGANELTINFGNGNGTFRSHVTFDLGANVVGSNNIFGDFNGDGILDAMASNSTSNSVSVAFGNGDGSFRSVISTTGITNTTNSKIFDLNGDSYDDLFMHNSAAGVAYVLFGNSDGTFTTMQTFATSTNGPEMGGADLNGDGAIDFAITTNGTSSTLVYMGNQTQTAYLRQIDLTSQSAALASLDIVRDIIGNVSASIGTLGANQSRLSTAAAVLITARENFDSASSQIVDADVAVEAANLVRAQILQQAAASILSQANQLPGLSLKLLEGI